MDNPLVRDGGGYRPHILLELRALTSDPRDPILRLRGALKTLLRSYGLRCVAIDTTSGRSLYPIKKESAKQAA